MAPKTKPLPKTAMTELAQEAARKEKLELAKLIEEKLRRQRANPMAYVTRHTKQEEAYQDTHPIRALFWGNRCFVAGTLVATPTGYTPIEKLSINDMVLTLKGGQVIPGRISKTYTFGVDTEPKPMIEFSHGNRKTRCTYDHPYRVGNSYIPLYQLAWGVMEAGQRLQLKLLCEQYGSPLDDLPVRGQQDSGNETSSRYSWILSDYAGWSHSKGTSNSGSKLDTQPEKKTNCKPHRLQSTEQQGGEFGMGNIQGTSTTPDETGTHGKELGGCFGTCQTDSCRCNRDIQVSRTEQDNEKVTNGTGATQTIPPGEGGLYQGCVERKVLEIRQVSILPAETVYDIEVEETHNFFANGVCVHNCGKTEWGAMEVVEYALGTHKHRQVTPPIDIWCCCPSYDQQKETTQKKLERYLPQGSIVDQTYIKKGTWGEIKLANGTNISFKSYEQGREKFQGTGKRLIWFDEEPPKDIWEEAFVRQEAGVPLDIILTMTPVNGMTWVYDDIYLNTTNSDIFVSTASWTDNPYLTWDQRQQMARGLSEEALQVRKEGKFVKRVGLVCDWWDRDANLKCASYQQHWDCGIGIDFGFSAPTAAVLCGVDYDDNIFLFDGFYETRLTTPNIGKHIETMCAKYGLDPHDIPIIADSAQANDIQQLTDLGFSIVGIKKMSGSNNENWDEYRARRMEEYGSSNKQNTKIHVSPALTWFNEKRNNYENWFLKEVEGLRWRELRNSSGEKQQGASWDTQCSNHAIDAFTYFLIDHADAPVRPRQGKAWEGKVKGTYIEPSPEANDDENMLGNVVTEDTEIWSIY